MLYKGIQDVLEAISISRCSSVAEQCFRKAWAVGSNPTTGSSYSSADITLWLTSSLQRFVTTCGVPLSYQVLAPPRKQWSQGPRLRWSMAHLARLLQ